VRRLVEYLRSWVRDVVDGWNRFWFQPADPATLGLIRIATGAMLVYTHLVWSLALVEFFGPKGWLAPRAVALVQQNTYAWSYFWWFQSPLSLWTLHVAALVVFVLFTVGLLTRVTSILALLATLSYVGRVPGALFGLDQINILLTTYLAVGPSGSAFSVDRWLAARRAGGSLSVATSWTANLASRLIQVHMCIIYFFAGTAKLTGAAWWDGTAMWMALGNMEYQSTDMTWLADWPSLINVMTHVTVFWELTYWALVWPRLSRPIVLLLAIPLHMGIAICLGMTTFGLIMLVGNMAFISPALVRAWWPSRASESGRAGGSATTSPAGQPRALGSPASKRERPAQNRR
jgi:hypothetical protein